MILTIDLGSSATKAGIWDEDGLIGVGRARLATHHDGVGRAEQDASTWWLSVVQACAQACAAVAAARPHPAGGARAIDVDAVVFAAARQTFVPVTEDGEPLGTALLWSDRRATAEAEELARRCGGASAVRARTGVVLDGASVAAKVAWLARHEGDRLARARWIVSPRDLVAWELTGALMTDTSLASASGLYDAEGDEVPELVGAAAGKLAPVVASDTVVGKARPEAATALGIRSGVPVVIGAGDRACEVLGAGASPERPMAAWGTTANVSAPLHVRPDPVPAGLIATWGALGGVVLEGGVSAAGSLLEWLARLTGVPVAGLMQAATTSPAGARGVKALAWMGGARAPWWRDDAGAGFVGLGFEHAAADLARAVLEAVAFDLGRCLDAMGRGADGSTAPVVEQRALAIGGSVATSAVWLEVLTGVTGLPASQRRSGEAAMAGAALVASAALGVGLDLERLDPVMKETAPDPGLVARYAELRPMADAAAAAVMGLATER